jgi:hypothetical protein
MAVGQDGNLYVLDKFVPPPSGWNTATVYRFLPGELRKAHKAGEPQSQR